MDLILTLMTASFFDSEDLLEYDGNFPKPSKVIWKFDPSIALQKVSEKLTICFIQQF